LRGNAFLFFHDLMSKLDRYGATIVCAESLSTAKDF
jgi:hypothetical protein